MKRERPLRVLVVDDSPAGRRAITQALEEAEDIRVVDRASDGDEGLRKAAELRPDVITLDLEMPRLDGFAFLRVLMARAPTPVIVVSSYAHRSDVFKALDLGAVDFVAKRARASKEDLASLAAELLEKVRATREVRQTRRELPGAAEHPLVVCVAASTGGPPAIQRIVETLGRDCPLALVVCQHMPPRFTEAFAQRLDRIGALAVKEAKHGDLVLPGHAYIAPGGKQLELDRSTTMLRLAVSGSAPDDKHAPSANRLFTSAARILGADAVGVVLTGMGNDGADGVVEIHRAGGTVWAEAKETAVIFGMPGAAVDTGAVNRVLPVEKIAPELLGLARRKRR